MFLEHFKSLFNDTTRDVRYEREDQDGDHYDINNEDLNKAFEEWEILKALQNLKSNKACGDDQIINKFLKASTGKMTEIYTKLFNLILFSGKTPKEWSIGIIKPIYKRKGSCDDPNTYRGITILSCFGKLFTNVINSRLVEYFYQIPQLVLNKLDSKPGIQQWIVCLPFIVLLTSFWRRKSVCNAWLLIMKKYLIVLKERFCGRNFWTLVLTDVY